MVGPVHELQSLAENKPEKRNRSLSNVSMSVSADSTSFYDIHGSPIPANFEGAKKFFFFRIERELEKVNAFYMRKESELRGRLKSLVEKKNILISRNGKPFGSVTLDSLTEAIQEFQQDLSKLLSYVEMNEIGFRKILKKWDKRSKSQTKEVYLSRQVEIQPCFNKDVLNDLGDLAIKSLVELHGKEVGGFQEPAVAEEKPVVVVENEIEKKLFNALISGKPKEMVDDPALDNESVNRVFWKLCAQKEISQEMLDLIQEKFKLDYNYTDDVSDKTCLHQAALSGNISLLKRCLTGGAFLKSRDIYGRTPLHYAAVAGHLDCCKHLLDCASNGIDDALSTTKLVDSIDHDGLSPFSHSIIQGHDNIVALFLEKGATVSNSGLNSTVHLCIACESNNTKIVQLLLDNGALLNVANQDGLYPIHLACRNGNIDILKVLLKHPASKAELSRKDKYVNWTPLFYAAYEGHTDCVKMLLELDCKSYFDESGWNPCSYALYNGHVATASLLEQAATVDEKIKMGSPISQTAEILASIPHFSLDGDFSLDADSLQPLSLPPPMIPVYGHNFLERKSFIEVYLGHMNSPESPIVSLFNAKQMSLQLTIDYSLDYGLNPGIPYNVMLPSEDEVEVYKFTPENLETCSLHFVVCQSFGSKKSYIAKGVVLLKDLCQKKLIIPSADFTANGRIPVVCPLLDSKLNIVGELLFEIVLVLPFHHPMMDLGNVGTYWKSAKIVNSTINLPFSNSPMSRKMSLTPKIGSSSSPIGQGNLASFVIATSLSPTSVQLIVQVTQDKVPVIYEDWFVNSGDGIKIPVCNLTYIQFKSLTKGKFKNAFDSQDSFVEEVFSSFPSLEEALVAYSEFKGSFGLNIDLKYPFYSKNNLPIPMLTINEFVDAVLQIVFNFLKDKSANVGSFKASIVFSSSNPIVCTTINMKQPNFATFYYCNGGYATDDDSISQTELKDNMAINGKPSVTKRHSYNFSKPDSIKEAVKFAKRENLLGLICDNHPFTKVPFLVNAVKESGLVLSVFTEKHNLRIQ